MLSLERESRLVQEQEVGGGYPEGVPNSPVPVCFATRPDNKTLHSIMESFLFLNYSYNKLLISRPNNSNIHHILRQD
jgi:hypothetical protein